MASTSVFSLALLLILGGSNFSRAAESQTRGDAGSRRAVLVGIDAYRPATFTPGQILRWRNLAGCVSDATAMAAVLQTRFGFLPQNILVLTNRQATRPAILAALEQQFVQNTSPGDIRFFYYAGHGSQVGNSLSREPDKKDETIVPADSGAGAPDIRDKELRRAFNAALDRGAKLTAVFDSCHSGSISRGPLSEDGSRHAEPEPRDVRDGSEAGPLPESRGALVLSACLDYQLANELLSPEGTPHGAFTLALLDTLCACPPRCSTGELYAGLKARLQRSHPNQEPVATATSERLRLTWLGEEPDTRDARLLVAVAEARDDRTVLLQGGKAIGLEPGCELRPVPPGQDTPRIEVVSVEGLTHAQGRILEGTPQEVRTNNLFVVRKWVRSPGAVLSVWICPAPASAAELATTAAVLEQSAKQAGYHWVSDPTDDTPSHLVFWSGDGWCLRRENKPAEPLGRELTPTALSARLKSEKPAKVRLFVNLPLPSDWSGSLDLGAQSRNNSVIFAPCEGMAHYLPVGRAVQGQLSYAWVQANLQTNQGLSASLPMPARTEWCAGPAATNDLCRAALRLQQIKAWLSLDPPTGATPFPYRLAVKEAKTGKTACIQDERPVQTLTRQGIPRLVPSSKVPTLRNSMEYRLALVGDPKTKPVPASHYVYVFILDQYGASHLLYPTDASGENLFPVPNQPPGAEYVLDGSDFKIEPPLGLDHYILFASLERLDHPKAVFEMEGVRTRSAETEANPLENLLRNVGASARSGRSVVPQNWSIQRLAARSIP
jgi:hypothetical protein